MATSAPDTATPTATVWRALWTSRLFVMIIGVLGWLAFGPAPDTQQFNYGNLLTPFGYFGNLLVSPLARWDSAWYLVIAQYGYGHGGEGLRTTFFPLYPLMVRAVGVVIGSDLLGGVLISLVCFGLGLLVLYKLAALELDDERAKLCVLLLAFFPMSFYFSAVYTESLFLALSVGCIYMARTGRWGSAAALGALAAASRNTGVMLAVPFVILFLYGPRADLPPPARALSSWRSRLLPRYRVSPALAWVLVIPLGLVAYIVYLAAATGHGLTPFSDESLWFHKFAGPFGGVWNGAVAAWDGLRQLIHGPSATVTYFRQAGGDPITVAGQNLMLFGFLVVGLLAFVGVVRTLPFAYTAYVLVALGPALSYPIIPQPLDSLPRYEMVVFPFFIWAANWAHRRRIAPYVLACEAVLLGFFTAQFATWRFVS